MQYLVSFLEGIITFLSPCLLPMLPIYISYFAGGGERKLWKTITNALGFVLGFTVVFVLMGALAGTLGGFLIRWRTVTNVLFGGIMVLFGLNYMGLFNLNFFRGMAFPSGKGSWASALLRCWAWCSPWAGPPAWGHFWALP